MLDGLHVHAFAPGIVVYLIAIDLSHAEIARCAFNLVRRKCDYEESF